MSNHHSKTICPFEFATQDEATEAAKAAMIEEAKRHGKFRSLDLVQVYGENAVRTAIDNLSLNDTLFEYNDDETPGKHRVYSFLWACKEAM